MNSLKQLLYDLMLNAKRQPAVPHRITLPDGLRVEILIHRNQTHLQLSREDEFPSIQEFWAVLDSLPYPVERLKPTPVVHSGRKFLTAALPIPPTSIFSLSR